MTRTPLSRSKRRRSRSPGRFTHRRVGASGSCSGGRGNVLAVKNCATLPSAWPREEENGGGISWRPPAYSLFCYYYYYTLPIAGALSDDAHLMSDVCRVAYIGPMSRTERPRKTKIGTEIGRVTCDSETTFKVKRLKVNLHGSEAYCGGPRTACYYYYAPDPDRRGH